MPAWGAHQVVHNNLLTPIACACQKPVHNTPAQQQGTPSHQSSAAPPPAHDQTCNARACCQIIAAHNATSTGPQKQPHHAATPSSLFPFYVLMHLTNVYGTEVHTPVRPSTGLASTMTVPAARNRLMSSREAALIPAQCSHSYAHSPRTMRDMGRCHTMTFSRLLAGLLMLRLAASATASGETSSSTGGTLLLLAQLGSPVLTECDRHFASLECSASLAFTVTGGNKVQLVTDVAVDNADCTSTSLSLVTIGTYRGITGSCWQQGGWFCKLCTYPYPYLCHAGSSAGISTGGVKYTLTPTATGRNLLLKVQGSDGAMCNTDYLVTCHCSGCQVCKAGHCHKTRPCARRHQDPS